MLIIMWWWRWRFGDDDDDGGDVGDDDGGDVGGDEELVEKAAWSRGKLFLRGSTQLQWTSLGFAM